MVPEQVELQEYWRRWVTFSSIVKQHPNSLSVYPNPQDYRSVLYSTLTDVKEFRDYAAHR